MHNKQNDISFVLQEYLFQNRYPTHKIENIQLKPHFHHTKLYFKELFNRSHVCDSRSKQSHSSEGQLMGYETLLLHSRKGANI